jgi:signal transduction histidine kinase
LGSRDDARQARAADDGLVNGALREIWEFVRRTDPPSRPSINALTIDAVVALLLFAGSADHQVFLAAASTLPLALRRWYPTSVFWIILLASVQIDDFSPFGFLSDVLAAYSAAVYSRFRGAALGSLLLAAIALSLTFPELSPPIPGWATPYALLVPIMAIGVIIRVARIRAGASENRARRLEREQAAATARAIAAERSRIARELHDVVSHNMSVMLVQAGAARQVLVADPDRARTALLAVESSGRDTMAELRRLLDLIAPVTDDLELDLAPQPGLDRLPALLDRLRGAGLRVGLQITGSPEPLPAGLDLAAYRIVQEGLTNVVKHAQGASAEVRIDHRRDRLTIDISDDGPGLEGAGPPGRGLQGLAERLALYGGVLDAGARPGGGYRLVARIPRELPVEVP